MPTRDIASDLVPEAVMVKVAITTNTTTNSSAVDTAHFDSGIMFFTYLSSYDTAAVLAVSLEDSPDNSVWTAVPASKLILPDGAVVANIYADGSEAARLGAFSTNRYVRMVITSTGVVGTNSVDALCVKLPEPRPHRV